MSDRLAITRVVNACTLIELDGYRVLTDPYFNARWFLRLSEPIGLDAARLPKLTALVGGHGAPDHWQPRSLASYPHRSETPMFVATRAMAKRASAAGWPIVEVLEWGDVRTIADLSIEVVAAQEALGTRINNYVLSTPTVRVFVGTEARDLEPLRRYRSKSPPVNVALLPIDGSALLGRELVMRPEVAIEAARVLGARTLIPIHYSVRPLPPLFRTPGSLDDLLQASRALSDIEVVPLPTGHRWIAPTASAARHR